MKKRMSTFVLKAAIAHDYLINTFWGGSGVKKKPIMTLVLICLINLFNICNTYSCSFETKRKKTQHNTRYIFSMIFLYNKVFLFLSFRPEEKRPYTTHVKE